MSILFKNALSLPSLVACVGSNRHWFSPSLLFEREAPLVSDVGSGHGVESGGGSGSESDQGSGSESGEGSGSESDEGSVYVQGQKIGDRKKI